MSKIKQMTVCLPKRSKYYKLEYLDTQGKKHERSLKTLYKEVAQKRADKFLENLRIDEKVQERLDYEKQKLDFSLSFSEAPKPRQNYIVCGEVVNIQYSLIDTYKLFYKEKIRSKRMIYEYKLLEKKFIEYEFNWLDLNSPYFEQFILNLSNKYQTLNNTRKTVTFYNYCKTFKIFLNFCKYRNILSAILIEQLKLKLPIFRKNLGHSKTIPIKILNNIFNKVLEEKDLDFFCYLFILYITTSRPDEIAKLQKKHFLNQYGVLDIRQFKTYNNKYLDDISKLLKIVLEYLIKDKNYDDYLFIGYDSRNNRYYSTKWHKLMEDMNLKYLDKKVNRNYCIYEMRCLRHTSATIILEVFGKDKLRVSLGHKNSSHDNAYTKELVKDNFNEFHENSDSYGYCSIYSNNKEILNHLENKLQVSKKIPYLLKQKKI